MPDDIAKQYGSFAPDFNTGAEWTALLGRLETALGDTPTEMGIYGLLAVLASGIALGDGKNHPSDEACTAKLAEIVAGLPGLVATVRQRRDRP